MVVTAKLAVALLATTAATASRPTTTAFTSPPAQAVTAHLPPFRIPSPLAAAAAAATTTAPPTLGPRLPIDETYPGLRRIHTNPDVYVIDNFLDDASCQDLIRQAKATGNLVQSPVAYAGWTQDFADLVELAANGPVAWFAILGAWVQFKDDGGASQIDLVVRMVQNFGLLLGVAVVLIGAFTKFRADGLQDLRTSTSTTIDEVEGGAGTFVRRAAALFGGGNGDGSGKKAKAEAEEAAALFEAPTVIRYEAGQVLAPHYDANRSAETEDANRGGQTLATLLVYLNDVERGGLTRFGKLPVAASSADLGVVADGGGDGKLTVQPRLGDALLFFPADAAGQFDERTEHEGCPAVDEKWIARIWRHTDRVPPPFGLRDEALAKI